MDFLWKKKEKEEEEEEKNPLAAAEQHPSESSSSFPYTFGMTALFQHTVRMIYASWNVNELAGILQCVGLSCIIFGAILTQLQQIIPWLLNIYALSGWLDTQRVDLPCKTISQSENRLCGNWYAGENANVAVKDADWTAF